MNSLHDLLSQLETSKPPGPNHHIAVQGATLDTVRSNFHSSPQNDQANEDLLRLSFNSVISDDWVPHTPTYSYPWEESCHVSSRLTSPLAQSHLCSSTPMGLHWVARLLGHRGSGHPGFPSG